MTTVKDLAQAQTARDDVRAKLSGLAHKKREAETELGKISQYIRGTDRIAGKSTRLPAREYAELTTRQRELKAVVTKIEAEMLPLKQEATRWNNYCEELRADIIDGGRMTNPFGSGNALHRLIEIRDKWQRFGEDPTRVNSMRLLASAFAKELTEVIDGRASTNGSVSTNFDHSPTLTG